MPGLPGVQEALVGVATCRHLLLFIANREVVGFREALSAYDIVIGIQGFTD